MTYHIPSCIEVFDALSNMLYLGHLVNGMSWSAHAESCPAAIPFFLCVKCRPAYHTDARPGIAASPQPFVHGQKLAWHYSLEGLFKCSKKDTSSPKTQPCHSPPLLPCMSSPCLYRGKECCTYCRAPVQDMLDEASLTQPVAHNPSLKAVPAGINNSSAALKAELLCRMCWTRPAPVFVY